MFSRFSLTEGRLVSRATKVIIICFAVLWNGQLLAATDDDLSKEYSECMDKSGGVTGERCLHAMTLKFAVGTLS